MPRVTQLRRVRGSALIPSSTLIIRVSCRMGQNLSQREITHLEFKECMAQYNIQPKKELMVLLNGLKA